MINIDEFKSRLDALETQSEKVKLLDEQTAVLGEESEAARRRVRVAYRDLHAVKFSDFDAKAALVGAIAFHTVTVGAAKFRIVPPSAGGQRAVEAYAGSLAAKAADPKAVAVPPIMGYEGVLLAWLYAVQLDGHPEQKLADQPLDARLAQLRRLPDIMVSKLASECQTLESWLSATLEIDLGN